LLNVLVSRPFYLPQISPTFYLLLIVLLLPLLILFDLGLECLDLLILTFVGLLLLALLTDSFVEAETGGEGANDCGN